MNIYNLKPELSVNNLIAHGIPVEMGSCNTKMRLMISDENLIKFKCALIEEDYLINYSETNSILEINFKKPLKGMDLPFGHFTTGQSEDLIFGYFQYGLMSSFGIEVCEVQMYYL